MGRARDDLETLSSLNSNCLLAYNVNGTFFFKEWGLNGCVCAYVPLLVCKIVSPWRNHGGNSQSE